MRYFLSFPTIVLNWAKSRAIQPANQGAPLSTLRGKGSMFMLHHVIKISELPCCDLTCYQIIYLSILKRFHHFSTLERRTMCGKKGLKKEQSESLKEHMTCGCYKYSRREIILLPSCFHLSCHSRVVLRHNTAVQKLNLSRK